MDKLHISNNYCSTILCLLCHSRKQDPHCNTAMSRTLCKTKACLCDCGWPFCSVDSALASSLYQWGT